MKIIEGRFQYTAIDDCTRLRVLGLYPWRTAINAVHFLENRMPEGFPFPIQRIQTDRGAEFFGATFQDTLRRLCIKFRPNRPRAPHLNAKSNVPSKRTGSNFIRASIFGMLIFHKDWKNGSSSTIGIGRTVH